MKKTGDLGDFTGILKWVEKMASTNSIHQVYLHFFYTFILMTSPSKVTDVVLGGLVSKFDHIAVLFFSTKRDKEVGALCCPQA